MVAQLDIEARNKAFYDSVWRHALVRGAEWHSTWDVVARMTRGKSRLLEIGPGVRPRFPIERTVFVDLSRVAVRKLLRSGARAFLASVASLPFRDASFEAACALDVVEHSHSPEAATREIARVLRPGAQLLLSVPLHALRWTRFDGIVGHAARFEPSQLVDLLKSAGLGIEASAPFGILPRHPGLVSAGAWMLEHFRSAAAWFEDRIVQPIARKSEPPTHWQRGFSAAIQASGALLLCTRGTTDSEAANQLSESSS